VKFGVFLVVDVFEFNTEAPVSVVIAEKFLTKMSHFQNDALV
jgi:hypothetical protein